jgi:hypothetical protein
LPSLTDDALSASRPSAAVLCLLLGWATAAAVTAAAATCSLHLSCRICLQHVALLPATHLCLGNETSICRSCPGCPSARGTAVAITMRSM